MVTIKKNAGLGYYVEGTIGQCPTLSGSNPLRFTRLVSEDLNATFSRDASNEVRGDAQSGGSVITGVSGAGSVSIQYSLDTYDNLIAGLMFAKGTVDGSDQANGWKGAAGSFTTSAASVTNTSTAWTLANNILTLDTGEAATLAVTVGTDSDYIQIEKSGNSQLDGIWRVISVATDALTLEAPNGTQTVAQYTGVSSMPAAMKINPMKGVSVNGVQDRSFGFVRFYSETELAGTPSISGLSACDAAVFRGAFVTSMQLSVSPGQAGWTGSLSTLFAGEESTSNVTVALPKSGFSMGDWNVSIAPNSNPLPDAILGVANVKIRNVDSDVTQRIDPLSLNMTISNNASEVNALRNAGSIAIIQGTFTANIDMEVIYENSELHKGMSDNTTFEVEVGCTDADGKAQLIRFPACKMTSERPNPGQNAPIVQSMSFLAEPNGTDYAGEAGAKTVEFLRFYDGSL